MEEYGCKLRPGEREMEVTAFRTILLVGFFCYSSFPILLFLSLSPPCPGEETLGRPKPGLLVSQYTE